MDESLIKKEARLYFQPFLLGNNKTSRRLSRKIFRKYRISSLILDEKASPANICLFSHRFIRLAPSKDRSITVLQLSELLKQTESTLPILIPCSREYEDFISLYSAELETDFILSTPTEALISSPLKIIPR